MFSAELLSIDRHVSWGLIFTKEFLRNAIPWIFVMLFYINSNIFNYFFLILGLLLIWNSNRVSKVEYDKETGEFTFANRDSKLLVISVILSLLNLAYCLFVKFFMM